MPATTTIEDRALFAESMDDPVPGLVVIFSDGRPKSLPLRLDQGPVELGRERAEGVFTVDDSRVSRRHARVALEGQGLRVTDLDSRNGTFVDGRRVRDELLSAPSGVLRVGSSLFAIEPDVRPFYLKGGVEVDDGAVIGPKLREARDRVTRAAVAGDTVLLTGPSGAGKELAARAFHAAGGRGAGPFIAVNCAAIPTGLAERLLFGARKGAYSGATTDAEGYLQAADGGTLFLDEVAELDPAVQPKLLRVLETREVQKLGDAHPRKVSIRICAATLKDLRGEVNAGRFREDLYYRIGRPEVRLPALSARLEELPFLAQVELDRMEKSVALSAAFLEACATRAWPGNVRELLAEVRQAARAALDAGRAALDAKDLAPNAGQDMSASQRAPSTSDLSRETITAALKREQGNVTRAAKALGLHRNQLRRWISKNNLDPKAFGSGGDDDEESSRP